MLFKVGDGFVDITVGLSEVGQPDVLVDMRMGTEFGILALHQFLAGLGVFVIVFEDGFL